MRVATANAASGRDERGRHDHARWVRDAVRLDVDVLGVQEVDRDLPRSGSRDQAADLLDSLGPGWSGRFAAAVHGSPGSPGLRPARADDPPQPSYGVALVTRLPVVAWHELRLAPSRARLPVRVGPGRVVWVADEPRVALAAQLADLTVVTTHLSFAPLRAVRQLQHVVRWARALPGSTVLTGDLNLPLAVVRRFGAAGTAGATYPSTSPRVQLDHVLTWPPCSIDDVTTARLGGSDHLAVKARVALG